MQKLVRVLSIFAFVVLLSSNALATNGDNLIAIGPIARAMGGVGIAAPQDAISAVFSNPAAMCFGPYCPSSEMNFAGTLFAPRINASVQTMGQTASAGSPNNVYPIPAIGLSVPITSAPPFWRFGLAAYGVSGLGVDYRKTVLNNPQFYDFGKQGQYPLTAGFYSQLQIMKFAPAIAFQPTDQLSFGLAAHIDYSTLDLGDGSSSGYGAGAQVGMIYKATESLSLGLNYVSPQNINYKNVLNLNGAYGDLELASPQQVGLGIAYAFHEYKVLLEADVKWLNWSGAQGYDDFDWRDQWVFAFGTQYKPIPKLALRAGYNYGQNPVKTHNGFTGGSMKDVQGSQMPTYYYETFRTIGFPAIVEHHLTLGAGYEFTPRFAVNVSYMHAFEKSISETGTNLAGQPVTLNSTLSENSLDFGFTWRW